MEKSDIELKNEIIEDFKEMLNDHKNSEIDIVAMLEDLKSNTEQYINALT